MVRVFIYNFQTPIIFEQTIFCPQNLIKHMIVFKCFSGRCNSDFFGENHYLATFANIFGPVA